MTREEVEAAVGGLPGEYFSGNVWFLRFRSVAWPSPSVSWWCDDAQLLVCFSPDGVATDVLVLPLAGFRLPGRWEQLWEWVRTNTHRGTPPEGNWWWG